MTDLTEEKHRQFNAAMEKYQNNPVYLWVGGVVSFVNVSLQGVLVVLMFPYSIGLAKQALTLVAAYIFADFVSGLVHMYMDNNDDYLSPWGPLVAAFHLHHRMPKYKQKPLVAVYYHETGSKIWLVFFEAAAVFAVWYGMVPDTIAYGAMYFAVFSSIAEVSHYLCHVPNSGVMRLLGQAGILMSSKYHIQRHHLQDNKNYTFLNCMTDSLVDLIANFLRLGYKNTTDTHYASYSGADTENRE
jgi:hypothetical protein